MKKFLMYVVVLVTILFVGYTTYYFVRNNEVISLTLAEDESIYVNTNETYEIPISWKKPYSKTKVFENENVQISDDTIVSYDSTTKLFTGLKGGKAVITVSPSNENFGPFTFTINVGDGSVQYPFYISSELQMEKIGTENYPLNKSYKLISDINLKAYENWKSIGDDITPFSGNFDGNNKIVSNLTITSGKNVGLFGNLAYNAVVSNLVLKDVSIKGEFDTVGAICGLSQGTIKHCKVSNFTLENTKADSFNGGIAGKVTNLNDQEGKFASFGYIDMSTVSVAAKTNGHFGGIAGYIAGSVIYNSNVTSMAYTTDVSSLYAGGIVGEMEDATSSNYMFSVIKNSYVIISKLQLDNTTTKVGTVVGKNTDKNTDSNSNLVLGVYYACPQTLEPVAETATTINRLSATSKMQSDMYVKNTFVGWDFENVWTTEDNAIINSIQTSAPAQPLNEYIPGAPITTQEEFVQIVDAIKANPSREVVYEISSDLVIDYENKEWTTLAPDINNPLKSSIRCKDNATLTIKNVKLSGANSSIFGYLFGSNAQMKGITIENVEVNSSAEIVAVVATSLMEGASIVDCNVLNANIKTTNTNKQVAVVAGVNGGTIENCKVIGDELNGNTVTTDSQKITMAGIVATNNGLVKNVQIKNYLFSLTSAEVDVFAQFGGIAAVMDGGQIVHGYNYNAKFNTKINGTVYAGGVCADMQNKSSIESCFSEAMIKVSDVSSNSFVGGVCAFAKDSDIKYSYCKADLEAYNVAGVCQTSHSTVDQCYFAGEVSGIRVAGVVGFTYGKVSNCYAQGSVYGTTTKSKASSLVSVIHVNAIVENCFANVSFSKCKGEKHAETESEFRAALENFFDSSQYPDCGKFENNIIINYGDAQIKSSLFGIIKTGWIDCTEAQATGTGDYAVFKEHGFKKSLWLFDSSNGEGFPTLINVVVKPIEA